MAKKGVMKKKSVNKIILPIIILIIVGILILSLIAVYNHKKITGKLIIPTGDITNLILHLPLDTNAKDYSGNHYDGTVVGNAKPTTNGLINGAYEFDGYNDYITIPVTSAGNKLLNFNENSFTISAWYYPTELPKEDIDGIVCKEGYTSGIFKAGTNKLRAVTWNLNANGTHTQFFAQGALMTKLKWYHVLMVQDISAKKIKLYVDGKLVSEKIYDGTLREYGTAPLLIGTTQTIAGFELRSANGKIDDVRIYSRVLNNDEINAIYTNNAPPAPNAYFPFDSDAKDKLNNYESTTFGNVARISDGKLGGAYEFDGVDDYIQSVNQRGGVYDEFSFSAWIKLNNLPTNEAKFAPIAFRLTGEGLYPRMWVSDGSALGWQYRLDDVTKTIKSNNNSIQVGTWHHVVGVIDENEGSWLYLDGQLVDSNTETGNLNNGINNAFIGRDINLNVYFNGTIDEVYIYNYALTGAEINDLYTGENLIPAECTNDAICVTIYGANYICNTEGDCEYNSSTLGNACEEDVNCSSQEFCNPTSDLCEFGARGCASNTQCETGQVCNVTSGICGECTSNSQCGSNKICNSNGRCVLISDETCTSTSCPTGYECSSSGACVLISDETCTTNAECGSNEICNANGECEALSSTTTCIDDFDCDSDEFCNDDGECETEESGSGGAVLTIIIIAIIIVLIIIGIVIYVVIKGKNGSKSLIDSSKDLLKNI